MSDDIVQLAALSIRARSRPRAVLGVWAWQSVLSFVGSWPAVALTRGAYGRAPHGDASLWESGSFPLLALLAREANGVRAAAGAAAVALLLGATAGLIPLAALMLSIGNVTSEGRGIGAARAIGGAVRLFRPLGILLIAVTLAQTLVVAAAILLGQLTEAWTHISFGEARAQQLGIAVGVALSSCALSLGVVHDLARAAVIRHDLKPVHALVTGCRTLRATPLVVHWAWTWRTLASTAPVVVVAGIAEGIGGIGGVPLLVLATLHQAVIFVRVALRASWLATALRVVDTARRSAPVFGDSLRSE